MQDDNELIKKFQGGDEDAFNQLVHKHENWVRGFVLSSIRNRQDAEDTAQNIFVRVYFGLPKFRFEAEFKTWIYRIVINQLNNFYRKQKLLSLFRGELNENINSYEADQNDGRKGELMRSVAKLPRGQRNVMILRTFQEMSFKEVAATLSISENSAKVSYHKAKNNLKKMIHAV